MRSRVTATHILAIPFIFCIQCIGLLSEVFEQKGLWHGIRFIGRFCPDKFSEVTFSIDQYSFFPITLKDSYWSRLIYWNYEYEPEIKTVFSYIKNADFDIFDCGANFGYWSLYFSSKIFGEHRTVAIESSPTTFLKLKENISLNGRKNVVPLNLAISDYEGESYFYIDQEHADSRLVEKKSDQTILVKTASLESIIQENKKTKSFLVKLDIEGAEIQALGSLSAQSLGQVFLIYEDHGKDFHSSVTKFVIERLKFKVFFIEGEKVIPIKRLEALTELKKNRKKGYNIVAYKSNSVLGELFEQQAGVSV